MSLKNTFRVRICIHEMTPNFPLGEFMRLTFDLGIPRTRVLQELDQLQEELDMEAEALRSRPENQSRSAIQHEYWCFYCAQVRAHYRMLINSDSHLH